MKKKDEEIESEGAAMVPVVALLSAVAGLWCCGTRTCWVEGLEISTMERSPGRGEQMRAGPSCSRENVHETKTCSQS
jgi:hypothetical protein